MSLKLFKILYNERLSLSQRYVDFHTGFNKFVSRTKLNHYQDLHAISVYFFFEYPETYYIYQYTIYKAFCEKIGFAEQKAKSKFEVWKLENYHHMCELFLLLAAVQWKTKKNRYSWKLREELKEALENINLPDISVYEKDEIKTDVGKNIILYGPPGTGKTYHTMIYVVAIIDNKELAAVSEEDYDDVLDRYNEYKTKGVVEFATFHQSYEYEEFIEGIKPVMDNENEKNEFDVPEAFIYQHFVEVNVNGVVHQYISEVQL